MSTYVKFAALIAVILGTLAWLAASGTSDTKSYYKTIAEISALGDQARQVVAAAVDVGQETGQQLVVVQLALAEAVEGGAA